MSKALSAKESVIWQTLPGDITSPTLRASIAAVSPGLLGINGCSYVTDEWTNIPAGIIPNIGKRLHLQPDHPIGITRRLIEYNFPKFRYHNELFPVVTVVQNFDSLGTPVNHPARSRSDTYYVNKDTVLRTHTSAHQVDTFRENQSDGFLISGDVYRRDEVDRTHNPIFHQMEGARTWDRAMHGGKVAEAILADIETLPKSKLVVEDTITTIHSGNPLQAGHSLAEAEAVGAHLKRSLEKVVVEVFSKLRQAVNNTSTTIEEPLHVRWVDAYFPFTSPSWELEVWWEGEWLEVLGSGVVRQEVLNLANVPTRIGWAFGIGLERLAMLLFGIPDIRLFWSTDQRMLSQFSATRPIQRFVPFSMHPPCYKDVSFWMPHEFHENDLMEIVRTVAGTLVEEVVLIDDFTRAADGRRSLCYRINYRSLERTLTNAEVNKLHASVTEECVGRLGMELR